MKVSMKYGPAESGEKRAISSRGAPLVSLLVRLARPGDVRHSRMPRRPRALVCAAPAVGATVQATTSFSLTATLVISP